MKDAARTAAWEPPKAFDSFDVERPLGLGGMGRVYLGRDTMLDRLVALKFIAAAHPTPESRQRFLLEARAIAKLAHPNVVGVFRIGEVEDRPYIAYEFVSGRSLDRVPRPMSWASALRTATLLARGLEAAHKAGIVHRDIKPGNVMLSDTGEIKLLDFGIAKLDSAPEPPSVPPAAVSPASAPRSAPPADPSHEAAALTTTMHAGLTRPGALIGTPAYLAPELWLGEPASFRSDVFAVGLVLYELLTGSLPFAPLGGESLARAVVDHDITPIRVRRPDLPDSFGDIVDRCLRRMPDARYASATELRAAFEQLNQVFLPRANVGESIKLDDENLMVAMSFARMLPRIDALVTGVYERLFALDPDLRPLFPENMGAQKEKLAHALKLSIDGLRHPDRLLPFLQDLGRRHAAYGVTAAHFDVLGVALQGAVADLDSVCWSEKLASAWRSAYAFLATAMRQGLATGQPTAVSGETPKVARSPEPTPSGPRAARTPAPARVEVPRTQYARNGDISLAYHVLGEGPDLLVALGWITHLELSYGHPSLGGFLRSLAEKHRVILFDKRGTGLSDRVVQNASFDDRLDDLRAVLDAAKSEHASVFGISEGGTMSAFFAAIHPERVRSAVLWGTSARMMEAPGYPHGLAPAFMEQVHALVQERWGDSFFAELEAPSMAGDEDFKEWLATYMRMAASPGNAIAMLKANAAIDLRRVLPLVSVPTLVMHREGDRVAPFGAGRHVAELIPGARFVGVPGEDHVPFTGDTSAVLREVLAFTEATSTRPTTAAEAASWVVSVLGPEGAPDEAARASLGALPSFHEAPGARALASEGAARFSYRALTRALAFAHAATLAVPGARVGIAFGSSGAAAEADRLATAAPSGEVHAAATAAEIAHALPYGFREVRTDDAGPVFRVTRT